jgi:indolepyruvate ferredoxin oxidoreductase alpha subunit
VVQNPTKKDEFKAKVRSRWTKFASRGIERRAAKFEAAAA